MSMMRREMEGIGISEGGESRIVRFLANTATWDRHGSQVLPTGASLAAFWKNPVFCWSHPQGTNKVPDPEDVIGRVVAVELTQDSLVIQAEFAPAALNPKAERCYQAVQAGFLRAVSIGFVPLEQHTEEQGTVITRWELLEVSLVVVGSNPDAVVLRHLAFGKQGGAMSTKEALEKLGLTEDASKEDAQKAYERYEESHGEENDEIKRSIQKAIEEMSEEKEPEEDTEESKQRSNWMQQLSSEVRSLRRELGDMQNQLQQAHVSQKQERDVHRWIAEGRYPAHKRDTLLALHKQGQAEALVESMEPGSFAVSSKRLFAGGDPAHSGNKEKPAMPLDAFDQRVLGMFASLGMKLDEQRYLRDKTEALLHASIDRRGTWP